MNEILSTSCPLAYMCYSSNGKYCPTMWTVESSSHIWKTSNTQQDKFGRILFFYFHRALSHPENLYLFWLSAISVTPKIASCGTKNFQGDDLDLSSWFWYRTNFLQCSQSLEKEQSLCGFNVLPPSSPESSDPRSLFMCYEWEIPVAHAAFPFYVNCT